MQFMLERKVHLNNFLKQSQRFRLMNFYLGKFFPVNMYKPKKVADENTTERERGSKSLWQKHSTHLLQKVNDEF